jgi:putative transposase
MGWMGTRAVDERMRFVMMVERQEQTFAAVCRRFGVSCRTGHKWLTRANRR